MEEMHEVRESKKKDSDSAWTSPHFRGLVRRVDMEKFLRSFVLLIGFKRLDRMLKEIEDSIDDFFRGDAEREEEDENKRDLNDAEWMKLFRAAIDQLKNCSKLKISNTFDVEKDKPIAFYSLLRNAGDTLIVELNGRVLRKIPIPKHMQECSAYHCRVRVQKNADAKSSFKST